MSHDEFHESENSFLPNMVEVILVIIYDIWLLKIKLQIYEFL